AASTSSSGIVAKNCRNMNTKNGEASHIGITSGQKLSIMFIERNRTKTGIIVTWAGSIIVESITMNRIDRPRNLNRAKPKPTSEHERIWPTTESVVTTVEFASAGQKFIFVGPRARG